MAERTPAENAEIARKVEQAAADFKETASGAYWRSKNGTDRTARDVGRAQANAYYEASRALTEILNKPFTELPREQTGHPA